MKAIVMIFWLFLTSTAQGQSIRNSDAPRDTTADASAVVDSADMASHLESPLLLKRKLTLQRPTMPPLRISEEQKRLEFSVRPEHFRTPDEITNWDALNKPANRADYEVTREYYPPMVPLTPLEVPDQEQQILNYIRDYELPSRQEMDILEILWLKEEVMDTTIYSCLDHTLNITMSDLNALLERMHRKGIVHRKQVSPRNEFNAFGVLIEMSMKNRRNKVYTYRSNVKKELMQTFIDANAYLFSRDSSIVNHRALRAARNDSTLLRDLNVQIHQPVDK
jgi:predicted transcriptional regulator